MFTLLQIGASLGMGSTGRIAEEIAALARANGWKTYMAHGSRYVGKSLMNTIQIGSILDECIHFGQNLLLDNQGLASKKATKNLLNQIDVVHPDIIHLHNIHGYYLNYPLLFDYIRKNRIPVVWTLHDCWSFTGHCAHFVTADCNQWKDKGCHCCPLTNAYPKSFVDHSKRNFELKKKYFTSLSDVVVVSVSKWLKSQVDQSFLALHSGKVIYNGVDTSIFKPTVSQKKSQLGIENKKLLIGVATSWSTSKGLRDYCQLAKILSSDYQIVLIGLTPRHIKELPENIIGIARTNNVEELVQYYTAADIVLNLSYAETFGLTTVEGLACGTPSIVYNATASPELISETTGIVVEPGDIFGVCDAISAITQKGKEYYVTSCRQQAVEKFEKNTQFMKYVELYNDIVNRRSARFNGK